jgi:tetratricopeptide (TPR) repeat protein
LTDDHLSLAQLASLTRGTLSLPRRRRLVAHLLRGCPRCSRLLAPLLAPPPPLPGRQRHRRPTPPGETFAPTTREGVAEAPLAEATTPLGVGATGTVAGPAEPLQLAQLVKAVPADAYDQPLERACATAVRRFRRIERERLVAAGAGKPPARQRAAVTTHGDGGRAGDLRRARGLVRVEMLLQASWALRFSDAREMVRIAELALFAAERLQPAHYGRAAIADVRGRAWAELANAHRVADDLDLAEKAMALAVAWQRRGSGDPWLVARIADLMASLCSDQRRFAEAEELLEKVHRFYRQVGDRHHAGRTLVKRGVIASHGNDPRGTLALLVEGLDLLDVHRDPKLVAHAVLAILLGLVNHGRCRQARIYLWRCRALFERDGGPRFQLRVRWLAGRIHAGLGELDRAERELQAAREGFEAAGSPYNAALVSLDLAAAWLQQGKARQVRQLVEEMIAAFRALRIAREAVAALLLLREACDRDEATLDRVRTVAMLLTELERQPGRRPGA